jgi:hypothetical protein
MRVGVDLDNTIVCYDAVFHRVGVEWGLIPPKTPASKGAVRDYLRSQGREDTWVELQGYVYGNRFREAVPFPGVSEFFDLCREQTIGVSIISHRTRYPFAGPRYDLHDAARRWLEAYRFDVDAPASRGAVSIHLELTKAAKIERIAKEGCSVFVDDLPEFLLETEFPGDVERILFDPSGTQTIHDLPFQVASSWKEIAHLVLHPRSAAIWI